MVIKSNFYMLQLELTTWVQEQISFWGTTHVVQIYS